MLSTPEEQLSTPGSMLSTPEESRRRSMLSTPEEQLGMSRRRTSTITATDHLLTDIQTDGALA
jgi:hypothetical protein